MAKKIDSISDGWEDVADDNLSVVSLPTSEDAGDAADTSADSDLPVYRDTDTLLAKPAENLTSPVTSVSKKLAALSLADKVQQDMNLSMSQSITSESSWTADSKKPQFAVDIRDPADDEARLGDNLDVDMDPNFLQKVSTSTVKLIGEILSVVHFGACSHAGKDSKGLRKQVEDVCKRLRNHLNELTPIMEGYSKHWNPEVASVTLPIDPGLYEWMSDLKVELLGVQALLQSQMSSYCYDSGSYTFVSELTKFDKSLNATCDQMASFIPIMKADYDDFHTANLPMAEEAVINPVNHPKSDQRGQRYSSSGPMVGHAQLRHEVYGLKDQISACVRSLEEFMLSQPQPADLELSHVKDSYTTIKSTLEILLSNHASEWIDHGLAGGITFPEFYRLNTDTIRSLNVQLGEIADSFNMEKNRIRHLRYTSDPDMMLDNEELQPRASDIEALKSVEEVLAALFQVKKRQSGCSDA